MLNWIKTRILGEKEVDDLRMKYDLIFKRINQMRGELLEMRQAFAEGGTITWEQLQSYSVSTSDHPVGYPTGQNCVSFRLPDIGDSMVFRTLCVAENGEVGRFGWHAHPKSLEVNVQIVGVGRHNGEPQPPYSVTRFEPGEEHDYELPPGGSLLTFFTKKEE